MGIVILKFRMIGQDSGGGELYLHVEPHKQVVWADVRIDQVVGATAILLGRLPTRFLQCLEGTKLKNQFLSQHRAVVELLMK